MNMWVLTSFVMCAGTSAVALMDAATPELIKNRGNIILTSSASAVITTVQNEAYHIAKAALETLVKNRAFSFAWHGVRVNALQPGALDTASLAAGASKMGMDKAHFIDVKLRSAGLCGGGQRWRRCHCIPGIR